MEKTIFNDINNLINAIDIFLFPSLYEVLPLLCVEVQTNGLPVVVSNNIPSDAKISSNYYQVNNYDIEDWIKTINKIKTVNRNNAYKDTVKNGYNVKDIAKKLEQIYRDLIN